ncbi:MAG: DUF3105 domain-containing protein [Anaerolinea sp.]|jgi:hypothetical protein|nr:DUF3105 domain-containing protein [Anaerolinea sp.]
MTTKTKTPKEPSSSTGNRRAIAQEERRKKQRRQRLVYTTAGIALAAILAFFVIRALATPAPGEAVRTQGNAHITEAQMGQFVYNTTPPTSGPHLGSIARWGIHTEPVPNELQLHNLEDGGVMVQYNCPDGCDDLVAQLSEIVARYSEQVILAPYPDMDSTIALTAWGRIDTFDAFDQERIERFIKAYRGIDHHRG